MCAGTYRTFFIRDDSSREENSIEILPNEKEIQTVSIFLVFNENTLILLGPVLPLKFKTVTNAPIDLKHIHPIFHFD